MRQVVGCHPLQHDRGRDPGLDEGHVDRNEALHRNDGILGVGSHHAGEGDVVPDRDVLDAISDGVHLARALLAEGEGCLLRVEARALVAIYKVDPGGGEPYPRFVRTWFWDGDVLVAQDLRPAVLVHLNRLDLPSPFPSTVLSIVAAGAVLQTGRTPNPFKGCGEPLQSPSARAWLVWRGWGCPGKGKVGFACPGSPTSERTPLRTRWRRRSPTLSTTCRYGRPSSWSSVPTTGRSGSGNPRSTADRLRS